MQYLTGVHALNLKCNLDTCGDWHKSALAWKNLTLRESILSPFGDYGLEFNKKIPNHEALFTVANHIRALLDLIAEYDFANAQGMKEDFICNDDYTAEVFDKILVLRDPKKRENIISGFLQYLNSRSSNYVLKGGTALAQCYGLDRFSEDIDLDGTQQGIDNVKPAIA